MALSTALIRAHLNLEPDDDRDEALLTHYATVAQAWVAAYTGTAYDDAQPLMVQAALLLVAHQYESREGITFANPYQLPYGVHDLLSPLKARVTAYTPDPEAA